MDCKEVQQSAGDAIDRSLPHEVRKEFEAHLERCSPCRREIALEKLSKHIIRQNIKQVPTPARIHSAVLHALQAETTQEHSDWISWLSEWFLLHLRSAVPALVFGTVALVFFLMVSGQTDPTYEMTAHTASNDIIHLSFENFALVKAGTMQPEMVRVIPESSNDFFRRSDLQFGVHVPKFHNCDWFGGSASECSGVKQAHLLYKIGNELIYVCEMSDDDALYGTQVSLPPAAKRALAQSGWYTDPDHPDCNVILWKTDEAVCVAVSTMKKGQLLALLTTQ